MDLSSLIQQAANDPLLVLFAKYHYGIEREAQSLPITVEEESFCRTVEHYAIQECEAVDDFRRTVLAYVGHCRLKGKLVVPAGLRSALEKSR